jgi:hypothetical protein
VCVQACVCMYKVVSVGTKAFQMPQMDPEGLSKVFLKGLCWDKSFSDASDGS